MLTSVEHIRIVLRFPGATINSPAAIYFLRVHFLTPCGFRVKYHF